MQKYKQLKRQVALALICIVVGTIFLLSNYISDKREEVFSSMNLELSKAVPELTTNNEEQKEEENSDDTDNEQQSEQPQDYESYVGILEINKIGFYKGFYAKESSLNNVKFNIKILDVSAYPDEENGNVIIIGHSGNYSNSYFADLYKLRNGDIASIHYKDHKYNYKIVNIYTDMKDGTVTIYRDENKNTMTLITCTKDDETRQTIYILELESVE